jgi:metallo-beta-lactamase family protein
MSSTRLFIVGYQGEETLGRDLLEGDKNISINNSNIMVKASVNSTEAMSSHADQKQLLNWLSHIKGVKKVFITHGEDTARSVLAKKISEELGLKDITLPVLNQEINL